MQFVENYSDLLEGVLLPSKDTLKGIFLASDESGRKVIIATYSIFQGTLSVASGEAIDEGNEINVDFFNNLNHKKKLEIEGSNYILASDQEKIIDNFEIGDRFLSLEEFRKIFGDFYQILPETLNGWTLNVLEISKRRNGKITQASYLHRSLEEFVTYLINTEEGSSLEDVSPLRLDKEEIIKIDKDKYILIKGDLEPEEKEEFLENIKENA